MDAIFLNPPYLKGYSRYSRSPCVTRGGTIYYPLMEIIATAYLEKFGFKAKVLDAVVDNLSAYEVIKIINEINPQVVCVATSTPSFFNDINIAENIKKKLPKIKVFCPKCGHNEAVWWIRQTRSADEAPTTFYRCTKCKYSWREYG